MTVHMIYIGTPTDRAIMAAAEASQQTSITFWTKKELEKEFPEVGELFRLDELHPAIATDIYRCHILHKHGGVYIDCDVEIREGFGGMCQRLEESSIETALVIDGTSGDLLRVNNWMIYSKPRSIYLKMAMAEQQIRAKSSRPALEKYSYCVWRDLIAKRQCQEFIALGMDFYSRHIKHYNERSFRTGGSGGQANGDNP